MMAPTGGMRDEDHQESQQETCRETFRETAEGSYLEMVEGAEM